jgi:hypothetical protein
MSAPRLCHAAASGPFPTGDGGAGLDTGSGRHHFDIGAVSVSALFVI